MIDSLLRIGGWSAYANAALSVANILTIMIFFSVGGFWGTLNDTLSVIWALSFIPLAIILYLLNRSVNGPFSMASMIIGIAAMVNFIILQSLLVIGRVSFDTTLPAVLTMTGFIGLFLLLNGLLARIGDTLPPGLVWLTVAFGLGFILGAIGFWIGGQQHPLSILGFISTGLIGPAWAIWLGRLLLQDAVETLVKT